MRDPQNRELQAIASIEDLIPDPRNANRGTTRGRALLAASLQANGAGRSILADRHGRVIAGNKTLEQARALNLPVRVVNTSGAELVVVQRDDLDLDHDARARRLAHDDNRIGEVDLDWDVDVLRQLQAEAVDLTGLWTDDELERLLGPRPVVGAIPDDAVLPIPPTDIQPGDLFALGPHRLICGDATDEATVRRLLDGATPQLCTTDPPYGVAYDPAWRPRAGLAGRHAVGPIANDDRVDWEAALVHYLGAVAYVWMAGVHAGPVGDMLQRLGFALRAQIIWHKDHFVLGRGDYHWQHEPCWYAVRQGRSSHWRGDRTQSTVWSGPNLNPITGERSAENVPTGHSTQKPVRLFEIPILNHTVPGDAVYDPFVGSGTAIVAAEKTGRVCYAIDIEPCYTQLAIERWQAFTGRTAERLTQG